MYWWEDYSLESISSNQPPVVVEQKTQTQPAQPSLLSNRTTQIKINKVEEVKIRPIANSVKSSAKQVGTISILQSHKPQVQSSDTSENDQEISSVRFTLDQLRKVWLEYTATIPTETILVSTMKSCSLELKENHKFKVVVTNADQQQRLNDRRDSLLPYLRTELKNTFIDMEIHVSAQQARKTIFSPLDKLNYMVGKNPNIVTLYKEFDLEIM